jgi:hypothetical protein
MVVEWAGYIKLAFLDHAVVTFAKHLLPVCPEEPSVGLLQYQRASTHK